MAIKKLPYSRADLMKVGAQRKFSGDQLNEISFPIGGIGTGCVSLSGRAELIDWQIFNKPSYGNRPNQTFFSLWAKKGKAEPVFRILEGRIPAPLNGDRWTPGHSGPQQRFASGLPRMKSCSFTGSYPFGQASLKDPDVPLSVTIEGWNPFIPTNGDDSSIPTAIFFVTLTNTTKEPVRATAALSLQNLAGWPEVGQCQNRWFDEGGHRGFTMASLRHPEDSPRYGTLALTTPWKAVTWQTQWIRAGWFDPLHHFCNTFAKTGQFDEDETQEPTGDNHADICSLGLKVSLKPGQSARLPFILSWHFPWHERYWGAGKDSDGNPCAPPKWKNYYAEIWHDARDVADYVNLHLDRLEDETRRFHGALFSSTIPAVALDAASSQMSILKTPTCIRLTDGTFWGWEGCAPSHGCCDGTCTHVWNYAQALPWLFPKIERSNRLADFTFDLREEDGHMQFRMPLPMGQMGDHGFHAAADGQMGNILKTYRDWLISGDDHYLKSIWPAVRKALEYAWVAWDTDKSGLIQGTHHNTYDIEFHGPEPLAQTFYLGALRAAEEMARYLGDTAKADEYRAVFESGSRLMDKVLWNGSYYEQKIPQGAPDKYQYGKGCLSDMLIGQWFAEMVNLGHLSRPDRVKKGLSAIFTHNWLGNLEDHVNPQRIYALNDEAGLLLCSWPRGGRLRFPFVYSDEVWCGIEYQVASHLIYEGLVEEGLAVVKGVRDRHDGKARNPWNEFECGNYYARSMASWAVLLALSGIHYSAPQKRIGFAPRVNADDFKCFFSVESGWGTYSQKIAKAGATVKIDILYGSLALKEIDVSALGAKAKGRAPQVTLGKETLAASLEDGAVRLAKAVKIPAGEALTIKI